MYKKTKYFNWDFISQRSSFSLKFVVRTIGSFQHFEFLGTGKGGDQGHRIEISAQQTPMVDFFIVHN
jgi:hypothetical protein